jgi:hypothetical protein
LLELLEFVDDEGVELLSLQQMRGRRRVVG